MLIDYELELPTHKTGQALAKSLSRILKHVYAASRVSFGVEGNVLVLRARIDEGRLESVRKAVRMTIESKKLVGPVIQGKREILEETETVA